MKKYSKDNFSNTCPALNQNSLLGFTAQRALSLLNTEGGWSESFDAPTSSPNSTLASYGFDQRKTEFYC